MSGIVVYTKPDCPKCDATKRFLKKRGAAFTAIDVSVDEAAAEWVKSLGYLSAPVVVAGDVHFSEFRPDRLESLIKVAAQAA